MAEVKANLALRFAVIRLNLNVEGGAPVAGAASGVTAPTLFTARALRPSGNNSSLRYRRFVTPAEIARAG